MQLEAEEMEEAVGLRLFLRYWALVIRKHYAASRQVGRYWQVELWEAETGEIGTMHLDTNNYPS